MEDNWKKTDPDNHQYGRANSLGIFEFKEWDRRTCGDDFLLNGFSKEDLFEDDEYWVHRVITLFTYSFKEMAEHVSSYYSGIDEVIETYGDEAAFIIAECIFEQESGLY